MEEVKLEINEKIILIENFIALSLRREKVTAVASKLLKEVKELQLLLDEVLRVEQEKLDGVEKDHAIIIQRIQKQQSDILDYVLKERKRKIQNAELRQNEVKISSLSASNGSETAERIHPYSTVKNVDHVNLHANVITPKMTLSSYKQSPFVKTSVINPIPFTCLDFESYITVEQFESIPKYMRGRESIDELRTFLNSVIIPCFNKKYQLMHRQRSNVRNRQDLELWKVYNQQASYVPGRNFITAGDVSQQIHKMLDKKQLNRIVMLRHLGVLQETRVGQTVCYIWTGDSV